MSVLFDNVKPGDTVHYSTPQGQTGKGKVVMNRGTHLVLNAGGRYGRPQVVTDKNYIKHSRGGKVVGALLSRLSTQSEGWGCHDAGFGCHGTDEDDEGGENERDTELNAKVNKTSAAMKSARKYLSTSRNRKKELKRLGVDAYKKARRSGIIEAKLSPAEAKRKAIKRAARNYADARRVAAANRQSPYKLGEPQMNAAKAFGWVKEELKRTKKGLVDKSGDVVYAPGEEKIDAHNKAVAKMTKKSFADLDYNHPDLMKKPPKGWRFSTSHRIVMDEATWQGAEDPYNWDPVARQQVFAAAAKKEREKQVKRGQPVPHKLDTGRSLKMGAQPYRRGMKEDSKDMEGAAERVAKTKKHKKLHEVSTGTLASYVSKAIADRKKAQSGADMARRIHTPDRAAYFVDKMGKRAAKRAAGIKTAVAKIAKAYEETSVVAESDYAADKAYFKAREKEADRKLNVRMKKRDWQEDHPEHFKAHQKRVRHAKGLVDMLSNIAGDMSNAHTKNQGKKLDDKTHAKIIAKLQKLREARENEWMANQQLASTAKKPAKGHYLMRDGRKLSGPHSPEDAVKAYKNLSSQGTDTKGIKIVHVKESEILDVTAILVEDSQKPDKYKMAVMKAVSLKKKAKGNKHVDTEPQLKMPDKGTNAPLEGTHADQGADDDKV